MNEERKQYLMSLPGFIILIRKPEDFDKFYGPVENSFSLGVEKNRTRLFWSGKSYSILGELVLDGLKNAKHDANRMKKQHPDWHFKIYDAREADSLPVILNWEAWLDAHEPSDQTFSGVKNKYECRNIRFVLKGKPEDNSEVKPFKLVVSTFSIQRKECDKA